MQIDLITIKCRSI